MAHVERFDLVTQSAFARAWEISRRSLARLIEKDLLDTEVIGNVHYISISDESKVKKAVFGYKSRKTKVKKADILSIEPDYANMSESEALFEHQYWEMHR